MERTTQKHNPRVDDELKHETEPLVPQRRGVPRRGVPRAGAARRQRARGPLHGWTTPPGACSAPTRCRPAASSPATSPNAFPGDRASLLEAADGANAPQEVLDALDRLPEGRHVRDGPRRLRGAVRTRPGRGFPLAWRSAAAGRAIWPDGHAALATAGLSTPGLRVRPSKTWLTARDRAEGRPGLTMPAEGVARCRASVAAAHRIRACAVHGDPERGRSSCMTGVTPGRC